jgi:polysaccharide export outer membrane protein
LNAVMTHTARSLLRRFCSSLGAARHGGAVTILTAVFLFVASCAPGSDLPPLPETPPGAYQLGVDDEVRIISFGEDQLTGKFRVNDRGDIAMPLIGTIPASGTTTSELEHRIAQRILDKKLLLDPSVSVEILSYRPIFVLGEVTKPGQYPYQPGMTVLTAVAVAGGFTFRAQTDEASILRKIDGHPVEGRVPRGTAVQPGDVVNILERYF